MTKQGHTTAYFLAALFGRWRVPGGSLARRCALFAGKLIVESDYPTALTAYQLFVADSAGRSAAIRISVRQRLCRGHCAMVHASRPN